MSTPSRIIYTPRSTRRRSKFSTKKIWNWDWKKIAVIGTVISVLGGLVYLSRIPYWQVKKIEISGLITLSEDEVKNVINDNLTGHYAFLIPKSLIVLVRTGNLGAKLKQQYPLIEDAVIAKKYPDTLKVSIKERTLWGIFCPSSLHTATSSGKTNPSLINAGGTDCAFIDKTGFTYGVAPNSSGSLIIKITKDVPRVEVGVPAIDVQTMDKINSIAEQAKALDGLEVVGYEFFSKIPDEIHITTSEGFKILLKRDDDFSNTFKVLKTLFNQEIKHKRPRLDYIDMRFGNKVFYKLR